MADRHALVTGGAGFIGSHVADSLLDRGWSVTCLDDLSTGRAENVSHLSNRSDFDLVKGSVLDGGLVASLVARADAVFHMAAAVGVRLIVEQPLRSFQTNLRGTETVLDA